MAQLIAFFGAPGSPGMPHIPGFQFWATKGLTGALLVNQPAPEFKAPGPTLAGGLRLSFVTCIANAAHAMVGALVQLGIGALPIVEFFFNDGTGVTPPGAVEVTIVNGDTAEQCATALINAINTWAATNFPFGLGAGNPTGFGLDVAAISSTDPSIRILIDTRNGLPILATTNNNGAPYGDALLHRAWRVFVYQGVDPALVGLFDNADIAIPFWPLHPLARKAFPQQFVNPWANGKQLV